MSVLITAITECVLHPEWLCSSEPHSVDQEELGPEHIKPARTRNALRMVLMTRGAYEGPRFGLGLNLRSPVARDLPFQISEGVSESVGRLKDG